MSATVQHLFVGELATQHWLTLSESEACQRLVGCPRSGHKCVAVAQAADLWNRNDPAALAWLNGTRARGVLLDRSVTTGCMMAGEVRLEDAFQRTFAESNDVIKAFWPN